jgi:inner membrane protein
MDIVTHALLGATLAYAATPAQARLQTRERLLLGGVAAVFPDCDFAAFPFDPLSFIADWHQGPTHSLVLLPVWAILLGGAFAAAIRRRDAHMDATRVSALGLASHIAGDLITDYGTAVWYPLSSARWSLGTTYLFDFVFTALVLLGLLSSVWMQRRRFAIIGLAVLCLYVGAQAGLQQRAIDIGRASAHAQGLTIERLNALPQPLSPFNWKLVGSAGPQYFVAHVNLLGQRPWVSWFPPLPYRQQLSALAQAYRPPGQLDWQIRHRYGEQTQLRGMVERLWDDPRFVKFRRFAVYPSLSRIDRSGTETCVWFTDLRYDLPALPDTFRYGFCRDSIDQPWELYRLRYFSERTQQRLAP